MSFCLFTEFAAESGWSSENNHHRGGTCRKSYDENFVWGSGDRVVPPRWMPYRLLFFLDSTWEYDCEAFQSAGGAISRTQLLTPAHHVPSKGSALTVISSLCPGACWQYRSITSSLIAHFSSNCQIHCVKQLHHLPELAALQSDLLRIGPLISDCRSQSINQVLQDMPAGDPTFLCNTRVKNNIWTVE